MIELDGGNLLAKLEESLKGLEESDKENQRSSFEEMLCELIDFCSRWEEMDETGGNEVKPTAIR